VFLITITYAGIYFTNLRPSILQQLNEDYLFYLKPTPLPRLTMFFHVLRNALHLPISIFSISIPIIIRGLLLIQNLFPYPPLTPLTIK
ncbi:ABC transporter permease subunit, partial [Staphylococcus epidermidis]|uniref:ABC transporter permease subunit n=1 Tax=Staphylococcus epidermidis TaxID=1282 RepID=UPI0011A918A2